ncbi:DUF72 domain-containing protein [Thauera butanivorans]|jgi:uncharacterized protein YecE (DUF72 family)|uniref:DUF72 domain-containing protein n=1 Tax=Thauera butanivorans TaxID=86174 RepID=UPI00083968DB|nr:DUF72 domain-containing protein [Thauera butanivorans]
MQNSLFADDGAGLPPVVEAAAPDPALVELAAALPSRLRFGTSSWNYPGWVGMVWKRDYPDAVLSSHGLPAYAQHPLFRTVGLDRSFYRPLSAAQYADYAAQVPEDFRFVVKAPGAVTDAWLRDSSGRGRQPNPDFLAAGPALRDFIEPVLTGLGAKAGALVFQISPLPTDWLTRIPELIARLHAMLAAIPDLRATAADAVVAVEVRDPQWLVPAFTQALRDTGATYCMGLHAKMPRIAEQIPILRALWPGPLVCRWNLNPLHGAFGYEEARRVYAHYDKLVDPDLDTRAMLARVIAGTVGAGQNAYVTLSNKAEGSSPLSVRALAETVHALQR